LDREESQMSPGICYSWVMVMPLFCEITRI
jgi:hypothetical protein